MEPEADATTEEQPKNTNQVSAPSYSLAIITQTNCTRSVNSAPWQVDGGADAGTNRSDRRAGRVATPMRPTDWTDDAVIGVVFTPKSLRI